jgi:hypothetical protein
VVARAAAGGDVDPILGIMRFVCLSNRMIKVVGVMYSRIEIS